MRRIRVGLLAGTALVAASWFTPEHDASGAWIGWRLWTEGPVYTTLRKFGRDDLILSATVVFLVSGTSYSTPVDWNNASNSVEPVGGGAGGGSNATGKNVAGGGGGGGGGYSKQTNITLSGSITYAIGGGGASDTDGGDTWFNGASLGASSVGAKGGVKGLSGDSGATGGLGGASGSGIGATKRSGGNGGNSAASSAFGGGGGGGAAGPTAAGNNGTNGTFQTGGNGGSADNGGTGAGAGGAGAIVAGGANPTNGGAGTTFDATHGCGGGGGGGGGGAGTSGVEIGATGGNYGGGGGGAKDHFGTSRAGGAGKPGLIVITYTPGGAGALPQKIVKVSQAVTRASTW